MQSSHAVLHRQAEKDAARAFTAPSSLGGCGRGQSEPSHSTQWTQATGKVCDTSLHRKHSSTCTVSPLPTFKCSSVIFYIMVKDELSVPHCARSALWVRLNDPQQIMLLTVGCMGVLFLQVNLRVFSHFWCILYLSQCSHGRSSFMIV